MPKCILTNEDKEEILLKSDRFTAKQLAEQYGCSRSTILKIWMDNNYHKPPGFSYYVDNDYFSEINTPNKAYVVGLIASDGNIYKRDDNHSGQLRFCFKHDESEYDLLTKIMRDMNATNPIKIVTKELNGHLYNQTSATIVSQQIFEDLCGIGILPQKTWDMNIIDVIENIPPQFIRDFLRGYFDGDGSITGVAHNKPSSVSVNIAIPLTNSILLQSYLESIGIISKTTEDNRPKYTNHFARLDLFGVNKYIFLKWIYYDECLCLQRKYDLASAYCKLVEDNITNRSENIKAVKQYNIFLEQNKMITDTN